MGKAHTTIGNWERNSTEPSIRELVKIAEYFHVTLDDMIVKNLNEHSFVPAISKESMQMPSETTKPTMESSYLKLVDSQQMNIDMLQQMLAIKKEEIEKLKFENERLRQRKAAI